MQAKDEIQEKDVDALVDVAWVVDVVDDVLVEDRRFLLFCHSFL